MLLKDVYAFTLEEIADFVGTTVGTIKSALHRGRRKMRNAAEPVALDAATRGLVRALVEAMNARDMDRILALMSETVKIDVCNVGGGRGRSGVWIEKTLANTQFEYAEFDGMPVVLIFNGGSRVLSGAVRVEGTGGTGIKGGDENIDGPEPIRQRFHGGYPGFPGSCIEVLTVSISAIRPNRINHEPAALIGYVCAAYDGTLARQRRCRRTRCAAACPSS